MLLFQNKYLIIDYGSSSIKGALCESGPWGERILRTERLPVVKLESIYKKPANAGGSPDIESKKSEEDRRIWNEYEYNIVRFVQTFFPDQSSYILNLPLQKLHVRDFTLPLIKPNQLSQIIAFEAEESLPYTLEQMGVVGHSWATDTENMHILAFGASHHLLENSVKPLLSNQVIILGLSVDAAMLACFIRLFGTEFYEGHIIGQLDLGASQTILNVVKDGKLAFSRSLPYGGNDLTRIVASVLKLDLQKAEHKKLQLQMDLLDILPHPISFYQECSITKTNYNEILHKSRAWLAELCLEIERSLLALRCPEPNLFYLSGGTSLTKGLAAFIKENLQRNVESYPLSLSNSEAPEVWATVLGAKKQNTLSAREKNNFLDTPFGTTLRGGQFNFSMLKTPVAFAAASIAILLFSLVLSIVRDRSRIEAHQKRVQELSKEIPGLLADASFEQMLIQAEDICRKRLRNLNRSSIKTLELLNDISQHTPPAEEMEVTFRKFDFDRKAVELEVELVSVGDTTILQEKFSESRVFRNVEVKRRNILPNQHVRVTYRLEAIEKSSSTNLRCR